MNRYIKTCSIITLTFISFLFSCEEDHEPVTITFYPALDGKAAKPLKGELSSPQTITLRASRVLAKDSKVNIRIEGNGTGYGYSYVTNPPQLQPGVVTVSIPRGEVETSFTFTPLNDGVFVPVYKYEFIIDETTSEIKSIGHDTYKMTVNTTPFYEEDFTACPGTFVERVAEGFSTWDCSGFGYPDETQGNSCIEANAFGESGTGSANAYLIMVEPIEGELYDNIFISAYVYSRFTGSGGIKFVYSTNYSGIGNPEADGVIWTEFSEINNALPAAGTQVWKQVSASLENIGDELVYIAIQHDGGTTTSSSNWRIDNISIIGD